MFTTFHAANWHPVTWFSHAVDYAVWGLNPLGHHLTSVVLHGINSFLVVILMAVLIGIAEKIRNPKSEIRNQMIAAGVTGLLFGLHPVHVESVAWVSERKDVLCALFFLLSILSYIKYAQGEKRQYYWISLLLFAVSLMSKPMAVTLPLVLVILDVYPLERWSIRKKPGVLTEKVPFIVLSIASSVVTVMAQKAGGAIEYFKFQWLDDRILVASGAIVFYLYKMLWPSGLVPFYPYPHEISLISIKYMGALMVIAGITAYSIWLWKRQKVVLVVWAYYLIMLLPVLGIVKVGGQAAADRYTYLPGLGPFLMAGIGTMVIYRKITSVKKQHNMGRTAIITALVIVTCLLSALTVKQIGIWKDSFVLWNTEISKFPDSYIGYRGLGVAYGKKGSYELAIRYFNRAAELNPVDVLIYSNRAKAYGKSGLHYKAIEDFKKAIEIQPQKAEFYNEIGVAYGNLGNYQKATKHFNMAIKIYPLFESAYFHRGVAYFKLGDKQSAIKDFQTAARLGDKRARTYLKSKGLGW